MVIIYIYLVSLNFIVLVLGKLPWYMENGGEDGDSEWWILNLKGEGEEFIDI